MEDPTVLNAKLSARGSVIIDKVNNQITERKTQMKPISKGWKILFAVLGLYAILLLVHGFYPSISCTVIDAETGKPIEGAVILAEWTTARGFGYTTQDSYKVTQVITDKDGKTKISGYIFNILVLKPSLTIYKKGYVAWNNKKIFPEYKERTDFSWSNAYLFKRHVFRLERFKEGIYSHCDHHSFIYFPLGDVAIFSEAVRWEDKKCIEE